jgi:sugar phosphate permease
LPYLNYSLLILGWRSDRLFTVTKGPFESLLILAILPILVLHLKATKNIKDARSMFNAWL